MDAASLAADVAELAERLSVPGVACAVDVAGDVIEAHHGITHVEHPLDVDGGTLFQIASMSKPFAATVVMLLVHDGAVSLADPVRQHLPDFGTVDGRYDDVITIRHLLTHTTGWDGDELLVRPPAGGTLADAPATMANARQLVEPGTDFTYNNGGFAIAGRLVETVTGQPFATVLRERILGPLRLHRTVTNADDAILHRVAMRHEVANGEPTVMYQPQWQPGWGLAPVDLPVGGLISCTDDLLEWYRFWLGRGGDGVPLDATTRASMCEPHAGWYNPTNSQGVGWALKKVAGVTIHGHGGLTAGYCSYSLFCPELDLAAAVLTNATTGTALCSAITDRIVAEVSPHAPSEPEPLIPQPDPTQVTGQYTGSFGVITVDSDDGSLVLTTERHPVAEGEWQPVPEPRPRAAVMYSADHAVVTGPPAFEGTLVDFAPSAPGEPAAWLRSGGRIHTRV